MTTLMSPLRFASASAKSASGTRRVIRRKRVGRRRIVLAVGVDRAEHGAIVEHHRAIECADVEFAPGRRADARKANDAIVRDMGEQRADDLRHAGAFHHEIGRERAKLFEFARVIGRAEIARERGLRSAGVVVIDVHLVAALHAEQCAEQPDRSRPGNEQLA